MLPGKRDYEDLGVMIHLPAITFTPTIRCNLRCRLCGILVPQYSFRPHMTMEEFEATLKAVFEIVDGTRKVHITGGEPLLHADLPLMLEKCFLHQNRFEQLWLFTNCAVKPSSQLLDVLSAHKDRIIVHCSDYGANSEITRELLAALTENGIEYKYLKYYGENQYFDGWVDQGDFTRHGRSRESLREVFAKCSHVMRGGSWYVRNGQMHWCGRSVRGLEVGKIPDCEGDYLNIFDGSVAVRREKLRLLMDTDFILACDYCNGVYGTDDKSKRLSAGEQL